MRGESGTLGLVTALLEGGGECRARVLLDTAIVTTPLQFFLVVIDCPSGQYMIHQVDV